MPILYTGNMTYQKYLQLLKRPIIFPRFKAVLLNWDNTDNVDISEYMVQENSSMTVNFQNGIRRTGQIEFYNDIQHLLLTNPNGYVWANTKIKLYAGISDSKDDENVVYFPQGVFLLKEPQFTSNYSNQTITYDLVDLFALFDDTLSGVLDNNLIIDINTSLLTATNTLLTAAGDSIPPIISNTYKSTVLTAQVKRSVGDKLSDAAGDIYPHQNYYYNVDGRFQVDDGIYDLDDSTKGSIYDFYDTKYNEYFGSIKTDLFDSMRNKIIVDGNNLSDSSSSLVTIRGTAENDNPLSPFCVNRMSPNPNNPKPRVKYISSNTITDNTTATNKAQYELKRGLIAARSYTLYTSFIPHLDVNQCVTVTDSNLNFDHEKMLIKQINMPLQTDSKLTLTCASVNEITFDTNINP